MRKPYRMFCTNVPYLEQLSFAFKRAAVPFAMATLLGQEGQENLLGPG